MAKLKYSQFKEYPNVLPKSGVLAWHPEVAMSEHEIDEFLSGRWVARLATNGRNGFPHLAPLWYLWDGERLFLTLTKNRLPYKNLNRDPRCSVMVDVDFRPMMGMRQNLAKAVAMTGEVEMEDYGPDNIDFASTMLARYGLWERDGARGLTQDLFLSMIFNAAEDADATLVRDNEERVLVKLLPQKIAAFDFSKAPIEYTTRAE